MKEFVINQDTCEQLEYVAEKIDRYFKEYASIISEIEKKIDAYRVALDKEQLLMIDEYLSNHKNLLDVNAQNGKVLKEKLIQMSDDIKSFMNNSF